MLSTPYTATLALAGALTLAAGLALLAWRLRPVWSHLRVWTTGPRVDRGLRAAGWLLPGVGLVVLVGADPDVALAGGRDVARVGVVLLGVAAAMWGTYAVARSLTLRWLRRHVETPRAASVARGPVASPPGGSVCGDATVIVPSLLPAAGSGAGQHRAGRATAPRGVGRPVNVRLTGAHWGESAPRRAGAAAVEVRPAAAAHQTPTRPAAHMDGAGWHGREAGWDQTVLLAPVGEQQTETWTRPAVTTAGR